MKSIIQNMSDGSLAFLCALYPLSFLSILGFEGFITLSLSIRSLCVIAIYATVAGIRLTSRQIAFELT